MQIIFWGLAVEISRPIISSLENVKISLPGTVLLFSVVCMLYIYILRKKCGIAQWGPFSIFTAKKKILPQKELDYMWPLISGLGRFIVQYWSYLSHNLASKIMVPNWKVWKTTIWTDSTYVNGLMAVFPLTGNVLSKTEM